MLWLKARQISIKILSDNIVYSFKKKNSDDIFKQDDVTGIRILHRVSAINILTPKFQIQNIDPGIHNWSPCPWTGEPLLLVSCYCCYCFFLSKSTLPLYIVRNLKEIRWHRLHSQLMVICIWTSLQEVEP